MAVLFPHTLAMPTIRPTSHGARFQAWGAAIEAMSRARERLTRQAWLDASAAWLVVADLHDGLPRDQKVYRDLAIDCRRKADAVRPIPKPASGPEFRSRR